MHRIRDRDSRSLPLLVLCAGADDCAGSDGGGGAASEAAGQEEGDVESICTGNASNSSSLSLIHAANAGMLGLGSFGGFGTVPPQMSEFGGLDVFDNGAGSSSAQPPASASLTAPFVARGKAAVLRPLEISPPVGAQPTLYQKCALRRNAGEEEDDKKRKAAVALAVDTSSGGGDTLLDDDDDDDLSIDASGLNYSEDAKGVEESVKDGKDSNANNSTVTAGGTGDGKGKRKGLPAKNHMAEPRRRKKLNDRLYMLRSVVPKISKAALMDLFDTSSYWFYPITEKIVGEKLHLCFILGCWRFASFTLYWNLQARTVV